MFHTFTRFFFLTKKALVRTTLAGDPGSGGEKRSFTQIVYVWISIALLALVLMTISIATRIAASGHGQFSNTYEFSVAFPWGTLVVSLLFLRRYRITIIGAGGFSVAVIYLIV